MTLAEYLTRHQLTRTAFARRVGVAHGTVSKWCAGARPDWPQLLAIHAATGGMVQPNDWLPAPGPAGDADHPAEAAA